jgi:hypothetical protein
MTAQNEIFKSNEKLEDMEQSAKNLVDAQTRMSMGVFGEFNVTVSQPTITDQSHSKRFGPNMHLTTNSLINIGGGIIKGKMLDRSSMISIKEHEDVVSPLSITKRTQ